MLGPVPAPRGQQFVHPPSSNCIKKDDQLKESRTSSESSGDSSPTSKSTSSSSFSANLDESPEKSPGPWKKIVPRTNTSSVTQSSPQLSVALHRKPMEKPYFLSGPSIVEEREVAAFLGRHKEFLELHKVVRIQKVTHPILNQRFQSTIDGFSLRNPKTFTAGTWENLEDQVTRRSVVESIKNCQKAVKFPGRVNTPVYTLTTCHGTRIEFLESVLSAGLNPRETTDPGYFGSARTYVYSTPDAPYAYLYGKTLLICKVAFTNTPYPMAFCDKDKFYGKPIPKNFDGLAVDVVPKTNDPNEKIFVCKAPDQKAKYQEIVVPPAQIDIQYVVEILPLKLSQKDLLETINDYLIQYPHSDQFNALNRKSNELDKSSEQQELDEQEVKLFHLLDSAIKEKDSKKRKLTDQEISELFSQGKEKKIQLDLNRSSSHQDSSKDKDRNLETYLKNGNSAFQKKKWDTAISNYKAILDQSRSNKDVLVSYLYALNQRARDYMKKETKNDYALAVLDLLEILDYDSMNLEALNLLGSIYTLNNCPRRAYLMASRALVRNPKDPFALRVRGAYFATHGGSYYHNQALEDLNKSIEFKPENNKFAYDHRAHLHFAMDNLAEAEKDCAELLKLDKKYKPALDLLSKIQDLKKAQPSVFG